MLVSTHRARVLKWRQVDDYHAESDKGGYTVCRVHVWGAIWYEAWRGKVFLAREEATDSASMRAVCDADWAKGQREVA